MSDTVYLVKRGDFVDIYIGGKIVGSTSWAYIDTACYFYFCEKLKVKIVN